MADTKIEWTDQVWNPLAGCNDKSEGCRHCYARTMARRLELMGQEKYKGLTVLQGSHVVWTGKINFDEKALLQPLSRNKPTRYFVNSMSDLFHDNVPDEWIDKIFAVMFAAGRHTFQVLTKRPERMLRYLSEDNPRYTVRKIADAAAAMGISPHIFDCDIYFPLPNVWLGVSVENQKAADERIPLLLQTPAAVRFLSCEPLLGPLQLLWDDGWGGEGEPPLTDREPTAEQCYGPNGLHFIRHGASRIDWVICGGESGHGARPMHPDWARSLRDQCQAAGVPFFFKQWGEWMPAESGTAPLANYGEFGPATSPQGMQRVGKKAAGALLDGREWRQFPEVAQ